jgi:hypothetical protein
MLRRFLSARQAWLMRVLLITTRRDAVREQLGLKLHSTKAPLRILVIDHIERPSEN